MEWAVEGTDLAREPILEPAQEYQNGEFKMRWVCQTQPNLSSSKLLSNNATPRRWGQCWQIWGRIRMTMQQSDV